MVRVLAPCLIALSLACPGCQSPFEKYFIPTKLSVEYEAIDPGEVEIVETGDTPADQVRSDLYQDTKLLGSANFVEGHASAAGLRKFAAEIGADLVIWSTNYLDSTTYTDYEPVTRPETTKVTKGKGDSKKTQTKTTTYTDYIPTTSTRSHYHHPVLYLRR